MLNNDDKRSAIIAWAGAALLAVLVYATPLAPSNWRLWGFDGLVFSPFNERLIWISAAILLAVGAYFLVGKLSDRAMRLIVPAFLLSVFILSLILPDVTALRGDGMLLTSDFSKGLAPSLRTPLTSFIHQLVLDITNIDKNPALLSKIMDGVFFTGYLIAVFLFARTMETPGAQLSSAIALAFTGTLLTSAGLVEYYAPVHAVTALALVFSIRDLNRDRFPIPGLVLMLIAVSLHPMAVVFLPAYAAAGVKQWGKKRVILLFAGIALISVIGAVLFLKRHLLAPLGNMPKDGYTLFDIRHLIDFLNLFGWAMPVAVFVLLPLGLSRKSGLLDDAAQLFLFGGTMGALGYAFVFSPDLGMARDADLVSIVAIPSTFWLLLRLQRQNFSYRPAVLSALLFVAVLGVVPQMALHHNEAKSIRRFVRQLQIDPSRSGYGWESLAMYLRAKGDMEGAHKAYMEAAKHSNNWRYDYQAAVGALQRGQYPQAQYHAIEIVERVPERAEGYWLLGYINVSLGKVEEGKELLSKAIERKAKNTQPYAMLAFLEYQEGKVLEAERTLLAADKVATQSDPTYFATFAIVSEALGKHEAALRFYEQVKNQTLPPHMHQALEESIGKARAAIAAQ